MLNYNHTPAETEIWKDVVGFEGYYQVSNLGQVKRIAGGPGAVADRILKPARRGYYLFVGLWRDGEPTLQSIHRLVAEAFLSCPLEHHQVNHKNGDKHDNRAENLEWVTPSENLIHACTILGFQPPIIIGDANPKAKLTQHDVMKIRQLYATGNYSQRELGQQFGVSKQNIADIVHRRIWKHVGGSPPIDRRASGRAYGTPKLTEHDVRTIRQLYATGDYTQKELSSMFGVSYQSIGHIVRRETWKHVV